MNVYVCHREQAASYVCEWKKDALVRMSKFVWYTRAGETGARVYRKAARKYGNTSVSPERKNVFLHLWIVKCELSCHPGPSWRSQASMVSAASSLALADIRSLLLLLLPSIQFYFHTFIRKHSDVCLFVVVEWHFHAKALHRVGRRYTTRFLCYRISPFLLVDMKFRVKFLMFAPYFFHSDSLSNHSQRGVEEYQQQQRPGGEICCLFRWP